MNHLSPITSATPETEHPFSEVRPRQLEFFYIDAGGGHRSAAVALHDIIKELFPQWEVNLVNLFRDVLRPIDPVHRVTRTYHAEDIYNVMLKQGWTYGFKTMLRGTQKLIKFYNPEVEELLEQRWQETSPPDLVVSLIPHFNGALFRALRKVHPHVPYTTVMTDLADYPPNFWQEEQDQFIICSSDVAAQQALETGYRRERIFKTSGMILKPHFYRHNHGHNRRKEREELGLLPDSPTALIMFGGNCAKTAETIVEKLERSGLDAQSIVMCGHNKKLYDALTKKKLCHPVSFTANGVPYYMSLADFFIGKPGPGSISEALHMGLPVITEYNSKTMPQERYNATWLQEQELGIVIKSFTQITTAVRQMLEDGNLEKFRRNARRFNNRAVYEVPVIFEHIMAMADRA